MFRLNYHAFHKEVNSLRWKLSIKHIGRFSFEILKHNFKGRNLPK